MKTILIEKGENTIQFVERVINMKKNSNEDFLVDFGNGVVLNTAKFSGTGDFYHEIMEAYGNQFGKQDNQNDDLALSDEKKGNSDTYTDTDSSSSSDNNDAKVVEENQISPLALESLDILTTYVISNNDFDKITLEHKSKFSEERLEEAKKEYELLVEQKHQEYVEKMKNIKNMLKKERELTFSSYKEPHNKFNDLISRKEEYNKIVSKYENEKRILEEGIKVFEEKLKNSESIANIVDKINEFKLSENKNFDISDFIKLIPLTQDNTLKEELEKIQKLKWNVEAYEEYIDFFYSENYLEEIESEIKSLENNKKNINQHLYEKSDELMLEMFPGAKRDENGKISYELERDHPDLIEARNLLSTLDELIKNGPDNPQVISDEILKMMYERKSPDLIEEKLNKLTSYINAETINKSFASEKNLIDKIEKQISDIATELESKKAKLLEKDPLNEDLIATDAKRLDRAILEGKSIENELEQCNITISQQEIKDRISKLDETINTYKEFELKNINEKNRHIILNGESKDDNDLNRFNQNLEFCQKTIASLEKLKAELKQDLRKVSKFANKKMAIDKKAELITKKEANDKLIDELKNEINQKRDSGDYIDVIAKNKMERDIEKLEEKLANLNKVKNSLGSHTIEELKNNILNYNQVNVKEEFEENLPAEEKGEDEEFEEHFADDVLEEIEEIKPAKKSLKEKIKSLSFKKIAAAAIVTIVTLATAITGAVIHKNNKEKEELKQTAIELEQTIDKTTTTGVEKMEQIAEKEKDKIEEAKKDQEENQKIVDISRIADDKYDAARGNFQYIENEYEKYYQNEMIQRIVDMQADGKTVHAIVGHDGKTIIGYTDTVNQNTQIEKTR